MGDIVEGGAAPDSAPVSCPGLQQSSVSVRLPDPRFPAHAATASEKDPLGALLGDHESRHSADASQQQVSEARESRLHYLEALVRASQAINGTLEPLEVAGVLADRAADLLNIPGVCVLEIENRTAIRVAAARGLSDAYLETLSGPLTSSIAARALAEKRTFAAWDVRQSGDSRQADAAIAEGVVTVACAPLLVNGQAMGALMVHCREQHGFTEDEFHVLSLLAAQGAVALANARAYGELRRQSAEVRIGFQRVGEALSASLDTGETLRLIVQLASEMTRADGGAFYSFQDKNEGGGLSLSAMRGLDRRSLRRLRRSEPARHAALALSERRAVVIRDTHRVYDTAFPALQLPEDRSSPIRSLVCVPVLIGDRPLGLLEQYSADPDHFSPADVDTLSSFALQSSVAIENSRLYAQEKGIAQTLQRAFLPELPPVIGGFEIGKIYAPGSEMAVVGGDTYDLFTLPCGKIAAVIGDVSGKGTHAATLAVMAKYTVRAYALDDSDPASVLHRVNQALIPQTGDSTFLTLCFCVIDPITGEVSVASAAHPAPLVWRADERRVEEIEMTPGLIAGFLPDQEYPVTRFALRPGDAMVLYTDGIMEARRNKVMFSTDDRIQSCIAANAHLPAQEIGSALYDAVVEWVAGDRTDDIALLVLKAN